MGTARIRLKSHAWRWSIALAAAAALAAVAIPIGTAVYGMSLLASFLLGLVSAAAIPLALAWPRVGAAAGVAALFLSVALSDGGTDLPWPFTVPSIVALSLLLLVLASFAAWPVAVSTGVLAVVGVVVAFALNPTRPIGSNGPVASLLVGSSVAAAVLVIGVLYRQRSVIRAQLVEERRIGAEAESSRALVEERNRIARELHDVIAHNMSVIQVQASSATYRIPDLPPAAASEFAELATTARQALAEMRQVLHVLRGSESAKLRPLPGIEQIPDLIDNAVRAGVPAALSDRLEAPVHEAASLTAYRVVQEALSNVIRHAPGAATSVELATTPEALTVRVENLPGGAPEARQAAGGHGLVGMRERLALVNGSLETGPAPGGGFVVLATIPLGARS